MIFLEKSNYLKDNKELMKEYNYEKNKDIDIDKLTLGSSKKIWWKCSECNNEWEATPKNRFRGGTGCPLCGLKKIGINHNKSLINKKGSLFDNVPELAKEWDYEKNYPLTPKDVTAGSKKKVWWICEKGHKWESAICNRTGGSGCIYCTRQKTIIGENDICTTNPELLKEWDYEKNIGIKPEELMSGSNKKVWWKCPLGHSWKTSVAKRNEGTGCPHCYSEYGTSFPEQVILYYLSKITEVESRRKVENQEIDVYLPLFNIGFEYDGSYYHETEKSKIKEQKKNTIIEKNGISLYHIKESDKSYFDEKNRVIYCLIDRNYLYIADVLKYIEKILNVTIKDVDIKRDKTHIYSQYIKSIKENNFTIRYPELLKEWDYEKNKGLLPEYFSVGSNKKVYWKCQKCKNSYTATIFHKIEGNGCPYCSGKKVSNTNNLKIKYPELSSYWDYSKNDIKPEDVYYNSRKKAWWICSKCGKSFQASICTRVRSKHYACFDCMHKIIGKSNQKKSLKNGSLFEKKPDLVEEWNYLKNTDILPEDVSCGSGKFVWWKCSKCGNEWQAKVFNRVYGTGCPKCYKRRGKSNEK